MALTIEIAGVDRTAWLKLNSLHISWNERATGDAVLEDRGRGYTPDLGDTFVVLDGATKRFAGHIYSRKTRCHPSPQRSFPRQFTLRLLDYNHILDRRRVQKTYEAGQTMGAIVLDIVANFLDGEGITTGSVETGPTILEDLRFNYNTVAECFRKISQVTGNYGAPFFYDVNADKVLKFSQFSSNPAPFSLTDHSNNFKDLDLDETLDNYRNVQYVRTEFEVAATYQEAFVGDGVSISFITSGIIITTPTVFVDGVQQTVGELGVDNTGKAFYWIRDGFGIFNQDHAVLTGSNTLQVEYRSQAANTVRVDNAAEITAQAARDGGSGKWEAVDEQKNINSIQTMYAIANGDLVQYGAVPTRASFTTYTAGAQPGQHFTINLTRHGINTSFFIEAVDMRLVAAWRGGRADFLEYAIRATTVDTWSNRTGWFTKLVEMARIGSDPGTVTGEIAEPVQGCQAWGEAPAGLMNGSNVTFTLANAPAPPQSLILAVNGVIQRYGTDFTISGDTITYTNAPSSTDWHRAFYGFGYAGNSEIPSSSSPLGGVYTLAQTPNPGASLILALNGIVQLDGTDFSLSGASVDYVNAPDPSDDWQRAWYAIADSGGLVFGETPTGSINGSNKVFVLAQAASCVLLVLNGVIQGEGIDFTLSSTPSGTLITYLNAPASGDWHRIWYKL